MIDIASGLGKRECGSRKHKEIHVIGQHEKIAVRVRRGHDVDVVARRAGTCASNTRMYVAVSSIGSRRTGGEGAGRGRSADAESQTYVAGSRSVHEPGQRTRETYMGVMGMEGRTVNSSCTAGPCGAAVGRAARG